VVEEDKKKFRRLAAESGSGGEEERPGQREPEPEPAAKKDAVFCAGELAS